MTKGDIDDPIDLRGAKLQMPKPKTSTDIDTSTKTVGRIASWHYRRQFKGGEYTVEEIHWHRNAEKTLRALLAERDKLKTEREEALLAARFPGDPMIAPESFGFALVNYHLVEAEQRAEAAEAEVVKLKASVKLLSRCSITGDGRKPPPSDKTDN